MFENEVTMRIKSRSVSASRKSPNEFAERLFAPLPGRYNRLAALLSFGQDPRWRAAMVDQMVASHPQSILDVACGPCAVTKRLVRKTSAHVVGLDLSPEMLHQGHVNVQRAGVQERVSLVRGRGEQLPFPDASFDALTFTYLLRYVADPQAALIELARVVKPGGRRARKSRVALVVVALHATRAAGRWIRDRRSGVVGGRALSGSEYLQAL
jgi:ubiquinone/menaquinone biosynthesis C-methylase UbiE